jgi:hypothetical protein
MKIFGEYSEAQIGHEILSESATVKRQEEM